MSISPKLSNSTPSAQVAPRWHERHQRTRHAPDVIRTLVTQYPYQIKFVIDSPSDCHEVDEYLSTFPQIEHARVLLMPQGTDVQQLSRVAAWLEPYCRQHGFHFCPRRQIEWFGVVRGT
jgi:7-carboxy-7-deazaguanine synthase